MGFFKLWFAGSAAAISGALIWVYAPILVPVLAVAAGLGVLVVGIVQAAGALERWNNERLQRRERDR